MSSANTMKSPTVGSIWRHTTYDETITIVESCFARNSTRNIVWKYNSTGEIGGCNSCEWFYDDWKPVNDVSTMT